VLVRQPYPSLGSASSLRWESSNSLTSSPINQFSWGLVSCALYHYCWQFIYFPQKRKKLVVFSCIPMLKLSRPLPNHVPSPPLNRVRRRFIKNGCAEHFHGLRGWLWGRKARVPVLYYLPGCCSVFPFSVRTNYILDTCVEVRPRWPIARQWVNKWHVSRFVAFSSSYIDLPLYDFMYC
jgi:hypothetical protein